MKTQTGTTTPSAHAFKVEPRRNPKPHTSAFEKYALICQVDQISSDLASVLSRIRASSWMRLLCLCIAVASLHLQSNCHAQNLVQNPGFEFGTVNWTFTGSGGVHGVDGLDPTHGGSMMAYLNAYPGYGTISQTIATVPDGTYFIDFWIAGNGGTGLIYATFGGQTIFNQQNPGGIFAYQHYSASATANSTSSSLDFIGNGITATYFFDDIGVTSTVPEPAACSFVVSGLVILLLRRYRSKGPANVCRKMVPFRQVL